MGAICRIISRILSTVLIVVVVLLAIFLAGIRLIGFTPYTVLSGSMEPTYHVGSIIYVTDVDPADLQAGDPVTYRMQSGVVVTHRVKEVLNAGTPQLSFETQGDANQVSDGEIPASAVIGKPRFSIPYLGYVSEFVQRPQGLICVVGSCVAVLIISYLVDALFPKQKDKPSETVDRTGTETIG